MGNIVPYIRAETLTEGDRQKLRLTPLSAQSALLLEESGDNTPLTYIDATGWDANTLTKTYDVKALLNVDDATQLAWSFLDVNDGYAKKGGSITHPSPTQVQVSFEIEPGASTYQLKGSK